MYLKFLFSLFFLLIAISCGKRQETTEPPGQKPTLLVSLPPYQRIAERVAGEEFLVQSIVPPGANPHIYEPTIKQIAALGQGSIWFRIGEPFENKIFPVLQGNNPNLIATDLRKGISLIHGSGCNCHHEESLEDRHIWLGPQSLITQIRTIAETLCHQYPERQEIFLKNANILIHELETLDTEIKTILEPVKHRSFLVSHPAFAYFCKEYNLSQLSIELRGKEPTSKHLTQIMQEADFSQTKLAIAMPQHSNKGLELISEKLSLNIFVIDPYSSNYFETMRLLAHLVADNE